ncbi:MAG: hypothetical protein E4H43_04480, partial [Bacteroidia bacterium]
MSGGADPVFRVRTPLVIVHGFMGSEIMVSGTDDGEDFESQGWGIMKNILSVCDNHLKTLMCKDGAGNPLDECQVEPTQVIRALVELLILGREYVIYGDVFAGLEEYLEDQNYQLYLPGSGISGAPDFDLQIATDEINSKDIFYFVYDWRLDNSYNEENSSESNAKRLGHFIDTLADIQPVNARKVNILVHSMGGLVLKSLIANDEALKDKINKVFVLGTPNHGASEGLATIRHGLRAPQLIPGEVLQIESFEQINEVLDVLEEIKTITGVLTDSSAANLVNTLAGQLIDLMADGAAYKQCKDSDNPQQCLEDYCSELNEWNKLLGTFIETVYAVFNPTSFPSALAGMLTELNHLVNLDKDMDFLRDSQVEDFVHDLDSFYQLLPSEIFYQDYADGSYKVIGDDGGEVLVDSLADADNWITTSGANENLWERAKSFHETVDDVSLVLPDDSYLIFGCKVKTPG